MAKSDDDRRAGAEAVKRILDRMDAIESAIAALTTEFRGHRDFALDQIKFLLGENEATTKLSANLSIRIKALERKCL